MTNTESEEIILFNNAPLDNSEEDVFDFNIKAKALNSAINNKARAIALIGEYGSGKSTLTNLLFEQNKDTFEKPIYINLWDCICKKENKDDDKERINQFTKSFLYQFASGNKEKTGFTRYINQRLSKNYGKLSVAVSKIRSLLSLFVAVIIFLFYLGLKSSSCWIEIFGRQILNELWLATSLPFIFFAFKNDNFLFSLWDSQGKIEPSDTDCFEIFKEIIEHTKTKKNKKQLVIIEDLDRTDDATIVVSLLKELYRFINLLSTKDKDRFVFIVSLKSEQSLVDQNESTTNEEFKENGLHIYSKIFDYTVWIRPLYFENIRDIVDKLLDSKFSIEKKVEILPQLYWIMKGHNLTVREIKDRLNEVFLLHSSLSRRDKTEPDVKYNKCSAVVYLQRQYPKEFQILLSNEKKFSEIVKSYYYNMKKPQKTDFNFSEGNAREESEEEITNNDFIENFQEMLESKDIENDYAMYFFNYPKNAYIMTLEERYVYDAIIHNTFSATEKQNVQKMIDNIISNVSNRKQDVIKKALSELMDYKHPYGEFIFAYEKIFEIALKLKRDYLFISFSQFIKENINIDKSVIYLSEIYNYTCIKEDSFLDDAILSIPVPIILEEYMKSKREKFIEGWRISIIKLFPDCISKFPKLFISDNLPIIDFTTLPLLKNSRDIFYCLDFSLITQKSLKEYFEYLYTVEFKKEDAKFLIKGLLSIKNLTEMHDAHILLKKLLIKNKLYEESLFEIIFSGYKLEEDNKSIIEYVQNIDFFQMSDNMLIKIDELITNEITDLTLIKLLESKKLYNSAIYSRLQINNFADFDFENNWLEDNIVNLGIIINEKNHDLFLQLRKVFINKCFVSKIYNLYNTPFEFVTEQELQQISDPEDLYWMTDFTRVTIENCIIYANFCNSKKLESNKLYAFFHALFFSDEKGNAINSVDIINTILDKIDFKQCNFNSLNTEQQNKVVEIFTPVLELTNVNNAIKFIKTINCHIGSLDELIQENISSEDEDIFTDYINCCNGIPVSHDKVIEYIASRKINLPLSAEITEKLFKKKNYVSYIIGKSLNEKTVSVNNKIPLNCYYEAFCISDSYCELVNNSELLKLFYNEKMYDNKLNKKRLEMFRQFRQTYKLIELNLLILESDEEKKKYIYSISHIDTYEDSLRFIDLIVSEQYRHLFDNDNAFKEAVKRKLWEIDPSGKKKPGVLKRIFTNKLERNNSRRMKPLI